MKKNILIVLVLFIAFFFVFLSHDVIKDHNSIRESLFECSLAGLICSLIFGVLLIVYGKKKKNSDRFKFK